jgi:hypothetical protein
VAEHSAAELRPLAMLGLAVIRTARMIGQARRDLRDILQARLAIAHVAHKPPPRRRLELRRTPLGVEMDELEQPGHVPRHDRGTGRLAEDGEADLRPHGAATGTPASLKTTSSDRTGPGQSS